MFFVFKLLPTVTTRVCCIGLVLCCCFLAGCGGGQNAPLPRHNPMGVAGTFPAEAEVAFARAHVLWENDVCSDPEEAITLLNTVLELAPEHAAAWKYRGLAHSDLQRFDVALADLTKGVRLQPDAEMYAYRGLVFMRMGNLLGARADLDRALELDDNSHRAYNFRAAVNLLDERYSAACADWEDGCANGDCTGLENARKRELCQ